MCCVSTLRKTQSGELPWPCYWGITLAPMALKWGYTMALDNKLKKTEFKDCVMREADFTEADLTGALFENCDLTNTLFSHTNLNQADFRTARNYSINLEMNTARKAKFSLSEVAGLLAQYDIVVE
jgi:fluoroquinolone resistance protein